MHDKQNMGIVSTSYVCFFIWSLVKGKILFGKNFWMPFLKFAWEQKLFWVDKWVSIICMRILEPQRFKLSSPPPLSEKKQEIKCRTVAIVRIHPKWYLSLSAIWIRAEIVSSPVIPCPWGMSDPLWEEDGNYPLFWGSPVARCRAVSALSEKQVFLLTSGSDAKGVTLARKFQELACSLWRGDVMQAGAWSFLIGWK